MGSLIYRLAGIWRRLTADTVHTLQNITYTPEETMQCFEFILSSNASDYRALKQVYPKLHCILSYFKMSQGLPVVEDMIKADEDSLRSSAKHVLRLYGKFLQAVVPTNVTFFHFVRESDIEMHCVALKYVLIVSFCRQQSKVGLVFCSMRSKQRIHHFSLLIQWLSNLISYRCSAIYMRSSSIDTLIKTTYLCLSVLLGQPHHNTLTSCHDSCRQDIATKLSFINIYMLSQCMMHQQHLLLETVLANIQKVLTMSRQSIADSFVPSYLFASILGYVHKPLIYSIILRLLMQLIEEDKNIGEQQSEKIASLKSMERETDLSYLTYTRSWSIIYQIIKEEHQDMAEVEPLFTHKFLENTEDHIVSAFIAGILEQLQAHRHGYMKESSDQAATKEMSSKIRDQYNGIVEEMYFSQIEATLKERKLAVTPYKLWKAVASSDPHELLKRLSKRENDAEPIKQQMGSLCRVRD